MEHKDSDHCEGGTQLYHTPGYLKLSHKKTRSIKLKSHAIRNIHSVP
jgi:hypothetical protein